MPVHPSSQFAQSIAPIEPDSMEGISSWRRRLRVGLVLGAAILLLILVPPLINANHYQRQIARSMSLSLGRPVHLDNVSLHVLPVPGLTLSNLVVSEDPAFGSEPTIRANTVEASLRLSSLWRRRVEFSTIRFEDPSVNLVRNEAGRWNLANVLLHAAQVNTAPTVQRRPGPAPRFPYIEATGGRVNVKLGDEKLPYSLTDTDFALWQPSPHQWRVRLRGQPDRTDANMTDPGTLRIEGDLLQATVAEDVHVDLRSSWHNAPVGEASLLLLGHDMGWRGNVNLEATLAGTLDQAGIKTQLSLGGLRRAEFAPAHPLDVQVTCEAGISIEAVTLRQLACTLPDNAPTPATLHVAELNLQHPRQAAGTLTAKAVPSRWALLWAALFSPRVPIDAGAPGFVDVMLTHGKPDASAASPEAPLSGKTSGLPRGANMVDDSDDSWSGSVQFNPPTLSTTNMAAEQSGEAQEVGVPVTSDPLIFKLVSRSSLGGAGSAAAPGGHFLLRLQPTTFHPDAGTSFVLEGSVSTGGYALRVSGTGATDALLAPVRVLPELGDDLQTVLPQPSSQLPAGRVEFSCSALWGSRQVCTKTDPAPAKEKVVSGATGRSLRHHQIAR